LVEKNAGKEWTSPARRLEAEVAQNGGFARRVAAALRRWFFSADSSGAEARQKEMGEGEVLGCAEALHLKPRRGERSGRTWKRRLRLGQFQGEREKQGGGLGERKDVTGGPHPSAARERGGRGSRPAGPGPRGRKGGAEVLGQKAE